MAMSRKVYVNVARILKRHREALNNATAENCDNMLNMAMNELVQELADMFQRDNQAFDRQRFIVATVEQLIKLNVQKAENDLWDELTALPESSYGAVQSRVELFRFTSFKALRERIRNGSYRIDGERPGQIYAASVKLIHIHHGDYSKCAVMIRSTHRDI